MNRKLTSEDALSLLEKMIGILSVSRSEAGTADLLCAFLERQGVAPQRIYNNVWAKNRNWDDAKPILMLNTHHDTVKPSTAYSNSPTDAFHKGGKLFGLGSNDAGASVVSLLVTFCNHFEDALPFNLLLDISAEEEVMGEHGIRAVLPEFEKMGILPSAALVGEPTGMDAAIGERGLVVLDCTAHGKQGHAARNEGVNAIYKAVRDIEMLQSFQWEKKSDLLGPIKMTTTMIEAGVQHNVVPDTCKFVVDIRTTDAYTNEEVVEILGKKMESEIHPRSTRIHASAVSETNPLVRAALKIGRKTYISPTTSDQALMRFPTLKMGPGQSCRSHSADEFVLEEEIREGVDLYEKWFQEISKTGIL